MILFRDYPQVLLAARLGSPLVVGVGAGEHFVASDASPLAGRTDKIVYLADHELAVLTADTLRVIHRDQGQIPHNVQVLDLDAGDVDRGGFPHYMLKEIFEQPESIRNAMRGRLDFDAATARFGGLNLSPQELQRVRRFVLTACGTSWHAALAGEYQIESLARLPVEVEYASELRYRNSPLDDHTLLFAITQSGETADTLAALREMKRKGHPTLAICNVVGSTIAQEADGGIYLHAGPEIGVASTKAFTSQCVVLALLALYFGRLRHLSFDQGRADHRAAPGAARSGPPRLGHRRCGAADRLAIRPVHQFPLPRPAVQFPHGPGGRAEAQGDQLHPRGRLSRGGDEARADRAGRPADAERLRDAARFGLRQGDGQPARDPARGGPVIAVIGEDDREVSKLADDVIHVPACEPYLQPMVNIIPLQLLAYHIAVARGCDVDKPRNLAKSVTVE